MSTPRTEAVGLGVIGLGMASLPHAKSIVALQQDGRVRCKAAWSPTAARRDAFAARWELPVVDTVEAIVNDPDIQVVLLITPPDARVEHVIALTAAGKHILMEKPVERTTDAAVNLVDMAEAAKVRLGIVFQLRFRASSQRLAELITSGSLGTMTSVRIEVPWWRDQSYYDEPGRGTLARDGGGVLISQAIHTLDLALALAGPVDELAAIVGTTAQHRMECENFVGAGLRFANGAVGSLVATTAEFPGGTERIVIAGTEATAILSGAELQVKRKNGKHEAISADSGSAGGSDPMDFPHHWHQHLIADFVDAVDEGREPAVTARASLAVHHLIDALLQSAMTGRHVRPADRK